MTEIAEHARTAAARRYSVLMIAIHWITALLVVAAWFTAEGGRHVRADPPLLHFTLGFAVLLLMIPRLIARWTGATPHVEDPQGGWMELAARTGHWTLYALLIAMPLTGWYAASRLGVTVSFLGIALPSLAAPVEGYPGLIAELHEKGGDLLLILAALHALIAIWHQLWLKDGTLGRMNPL
jgi:cytochrome b561